MSAFSSNIVIIYREGTQITPSEQIFCFIHYDVN